MLFKQFLQKNLIWIVLAIVLIGGAFFLFAEIADDVFEKEKFQIDQMASQFVSSIQSDTLDSIFGFITESLELYCCFIPVIDCGVFFILLLR